MYKCSGLAEIVRDPSPTTMKYLRLWFRGDGAFGNALAMLDWPVVKDESSLLVWSKKDGLRVDLQIEERVMYSNTLLRYLKKDNEYQLTVDYKKLLSLRNILGTVQAIWSQSKLLVNYQKSYDLAKNYVESIPIEIASDLKDVEKMLEDKVWPKVIAVDYMGEFVYSAMTHNLNAKEKSKLIQKLHNRIGPEDWYTKAILAWSKVQDGKVQVEEFVDQYGFAAGDDYELTKPRFYELLNHPKPKLKKIDIEEMKVLTLEDLYVGLQCLRSQAKRRSLIWISALRDYVVKD
mgnify:CR=1 FL=1